MRLIDLDDYSHCFTGNCGDYENWNIDPDIPTVNAIPVSYIQQRIDRLRVLAEYEAEANGGYIGATHIAWHELEKILIEWKEERDANQDKTD